MKTPTHFKVISYMLVAIIVVALVKPSLQTYAQGGIPDLISLEYITVPNVLLADIPSQQALIGNRVDGTLVLENPLYSLYLAFDVDPSEEGLIQPDSILTSLWDGFKIIPPGAKVQYKVQFFTTSQQIEIRSDLLNTRAIVVNLITQSIGLIPGVSAKSPSQLVQAIGNTAELVEKIQVFVDLREAQSLVQEPFDPRTPSRIITIAKGMETFLKSSQGRSYVLNVLQKVGINNVDNNLLDKVFSWISILNRIKVVSDGLVYLGMSAWSGQFNNRYVLRPLSFDPNNRLPFTPKLKTPLGLNVSRQPRFEWAPALHATSYTLQVSTNTGFSSRIIDISLSQNFYNPSSSLEPDTTYYWRVFSHNQVGTSAGNVGTFTTGPFQYDSEYPKEGTESATFISDITLPDNGPPRTPGEVLPKTWRVRNSGKASWEGFKLIFVGGHQMGATNPVDIPRTAPGQEINISITIRVPDAPSRGDWQIVNREGVWVPGGNLWVIVTTPGGQSQPPPDDITIMPMESPVLAPCETYRPTVAVRVNRGQLRESSGDMLRNTDGKLYGAWPHVAVKGTVSAEQSYPFQFYENDPIKVPCDEGTYESKWRVWRSGNYVGPEVTIRFDVRNGGGQRPNPPTPQSPANWHVSRDGSTPTLCANSSGGVQYFFQIFEGHTTPDSGWISNNCWTPPTLGSYTYQWHVKARSGSLESDWSETRYFSIDSQELTLDDLVFSPGSPSAADEVRIYTCARGFGSLGLSLELYANTATDGSANGDWQYIHPLGTFCYNRDDTNTWPTWPTLPLADGTHLIRAIGFHNDQTIVKEATYTLQHRRSNGTALLSPVDDIWLNDRTVTFRWGPSTNAQGYRLYVATTDNRDNPDIFSDEFDANTLSHTLTLSQDYPSLYWWLGSHNDVGENCCSRAHFGIDRIAPTSAVAALPSSMTDTQFTIQWSGNDDRSQVRWYDIQYRDGAEGEWLDWQVNVIKVGEIFGGQPGHTYCFRVRAMDVAGNWEAYPGGSGDTCTIIDLSAAGGDWWHPDYAFRHNLVVLNNDGAALPAGYPIHLHFDSNTSPTAAELYAASQAAVKGDDVRIVLNNQAQLDRFIHVFSQERIDIWFNLQSGIGATPSDDSTSYQIYYGNSSATNPPGTVNSVLSPGTDANTVGLWHFQELSGDTLLDSSGRGHNGSITNGSRDLSGKFGGAVVFNGSSTLLNMGDHADFDLRSFTIEGWYYFASPGTQSLLWRDRASGQIEAYNLATRDGKIEAGIDGRNGLRSQTQFQANRWYHLAITYDGTTERVFVNGKEEGTSSDTGGTPASAGPIIIGRNRANSDWFSGKMQHIRVSNVARTSFPYGSYADILVEPTTAAGDATQRPQPGTPDLVVEGVSVFNTADGTIVQTIVTNQGDGATGNGFWVDLYENYQPTGLGDTSESIRYWVASPIDAGATLSLTTIVTQTQIAIAQMAALQETSSTLYVQADSRGTVLDPNKENNISLPAELCLAAADTFEGNNSSATATLLTLDAPKQTHNFDVVEDQDWFKFTATAGQSYIFETGDLGASADTYLYLYGPNGTTLLGSNDDNGETLASRLQWEARSSGTYYLVVKHWNPNMGGCGTSYSIAVTSAPTMTAGDCNGDQAVNVADAISVAREFYDGDNNNDPASAPNGVFPGTPACDANKDGAINVADAICISRIFYDGPGACNAISSTETPYKFDATHNFVEPDRVPFTPLPHESEIYLPYMSSNR